MAYNKSKKIYFVLSLLAGLCSFAGGFYLFLWAGSNFMYGYTLEAIFFALLLFVLSLVFFVFAYNLHHSAQTKYRRKIT